MQISSGGHSVQAQLSRRSFLRGTAVATAGANMIEAASAVIGRAEAAESGGPAASGPEPVPITLKVNGSDAGRCRSSRG